MNKISKDDIKKIKFAISNETIISCDGIGSRLVITKERLNELALYCYRVCFTSGSNTIESKE
jgi:hypothetical protein